MRILDLTAGNRGIWFNKNHPCALYLDIRPSVKPDVVADVRDKLLLKVASDENGHAHLYDLVVFDPPHLNFGKKSNMAKTYGHHTTAEIMDLIERGQREAWLVTRKDALLALKWNDHSISLKRVLAKMPYWEPLFGHGVSESHRRNKATSWVMLRRRPAACVSPKISQEGDK